MTEHRALCGWLLKQDAQSLWKGWKKRWFQQLHDFHLYYFPSCTTDISLSKGFIDLKTVLNVQQDASSKEKYVFNVITAERTYVLQATSDDEVNYWISGLNAIIANLSQPLATLISKAELFEKQHQQLQQQRRATASTVANAKADERKSRHASMRVIDSRALDQDFETGEMHRSNSMRNITYIDYANTPAPPKLDNATQASRHHSPPAPASTPPTYTSASAPTSPAHPASNPGSASSSLKSLSQLDEQEKKFASMRDLQALIVREKDSEIARLTMEVVRLTELQEKTADQVRQECQLQIDKIKAEEHLRFSDMERRLREQAEEASYNLRKSEEECVRMRETARVATEENEMARAELAHNKQIMEQKISILESEIKLKENMITQLNNTICSINGELSSKDILLENKLREIPYATAYDDMAVVAQLKKERETRHALQEQCAFLGQEVFKLETELKHQRILVEEQKNKILERSSLPNSPNIRSYADFSASSSASLGANNGNGSTSGNFDSIAEDSLQIKLLAIENKELRQKYFMSVGRSLKLQTTMDGGYTNISVADLYEQAINKNIKIEEWPNWISANIVNSLNPT
jgi:hypothetical protein